MRPATNLLAAALGAAMVFSTPVLAQDAPTFFRIGTGGAGGTYFPIGGTIANAISAPPGARACDEGGQCGVPGLIAIAQSTNASVQNNLAVQNGELEAGMAAADKPDTRSWATLPARIAVVRAELPPGQHVVQVNVLGRQHRFEVDVGATQWVVVDVAELATR